MTDDTERIAALEAEVADLRAKVSKLLRRFVAMDSPPPRQTYVNEVRNTFATTARDVIPMAELVKLSGVSRPTINRCIAHFPDVFIKGRVLPPDGLRGRPSIVVARTPRTGHTRPTHIGGSEILWDAVEG